MLAEAPVTSSRYFLSPFFTYKSYSLFFSATPNRISSRLSFSANRATTQPSPATHQRAE
ncbi:hypothetical protein LguiA_013124 [Lonicera macranthoides]